MRQARISIDASGTGFALSISGIPVYACDECRSSLQFADYGETVDAVITAVISVLDRLAPTGYGSPTHTPRQCNRCRENLPREMDGSRAHFADSIPLGPGGVMIGVKYFGNALTCPHCGTRHPYVTPVTFHEIADSIRRAATLYERT